MKSTPHRLAKVYADKEYSGWNYTRDGLYKVPRVKSTDKRMRQKKMRRYLKQTLNKESE